MSVIRKLEKSVNNAQLSYNKYIGENLAIAIVSVGSSLVNSARKMYFTTRGIKNPEYKERSRKFDIAAIVKEDISDIKEAYDMVNEIYGLIIKDKIVFSK